MSTFDRSKLKATSMADLNKQQHDVAEATAYAGRVANHDVKTNGDYLMRIYPAHPDTKSFWYAYSKSFLPHLVDDTDKDGESTGKKVERKFVVFNSRVHGGTPKDIVESYIDTAYKLARRDIKDAKAREEKLEPIGAWGTKIRPNTTWIMYADMIKGSKDNRTYDFGTLEISNAQKKTLNSMAHTYSTEALDPDPYSDPDDGRAFTISRTSDTSKKKEQDVAYTFAPRDRGEFPISDERLEKFMEVTPLEERYGDNVYSITDFEKALMGLEYFDQKYEMGVFGTDEWNDLVEEIAAYYPEVEDEEEDAKPAPVKVKEQVKEQDEEVETPSAGTGKSPLFVMNMEELKAYIEEKGLPIRVMSRYTEEDLVEIIQEEEAILAENSSKGGAEVVESVEEEKPWEKPNKTDDTPAPKKGADRLKAIRDKVKKNASV